MLSTFLLVYIYGGYVFHFYFYYDMMKVRMLQRKARRRRRSVLDFVQIPPLENVKKNPKGGCL